MRLASCAEEDITAFLDLFDNACKPLTCDCEAYNIEADSVEVRSSNESVDKRERYAVVCGSRGSGAVFELSKLVVRISYSASMVRSLSLTDG